MSNAEPGLIIISADLITRMADIGLVLVVDNPLAIHWAPIDTTNKEQN